MRIAIIGTGLIGGSIALAFREKYKQDLYVQAFDHNLARLQLAKRLGVIDEGFQDVDEALEEADFVFLCTPVQTLCRLIEPVLLSSRLKAGAIVTDVGSTKANIVQMSNQFVNNSKGVFIGGHPMAGSHKSGVEAASERLFENAYYVLTPTDDTANEDVQRLETALAATNAQIVRMDAEEHDQVVGAISHFPHVIASSLVEHLHDYQSDSVWYFRLAAGGFRDITRIASSNPHMWRDIVLSNRDVLLKLMKDWQIQMQHVTDLIESQDAEDIETFFTHAKDVRDTLPEKKRGAIPSFFDLYVDIPDHPGVIGQVTTLLGIYEISIVNLSIMETREDIYGALRLSFRHEHDLEQAEQVLSAAHFQVYHPD